jgi:arylsulfatase A-like enzyme
MNRNTPGFVGVFLLVAATAVFADTHKNKTPSVQQQANILLIVLDDAGYGDIAGFAASQAPTPTLKQLGDEGVRFTRFYADSTCRPARVSLMTGRQASRVAMSPDFHGISPEVETLPEKLKQAGYSTQHIGKWHLGDTTKLSWPLAQGFDHWFGFLNQFVLRGPNEKGEMVPHRPTYTNPWLQTDDGKPQQYQGHLEDILADHAVETIQALKKSAQPWFIQYALLSPHNPAHPSDAYRKLFPKDKAGQYSALLKQMDDEIGRVLKALEETGQVDNTMVIVLSDNGGTNELEANNGPFEGEKGRYSEGGTRTPMIIRWPKNMDVPAKPYDGISAIYDVYPTLLAIAGVDLAHDTQKIDGVNLLPLVLKQQPRPAQALFWEIGSDYNYNYSVLSADGRWRLDDEHLYDLHKDPFAKKNIAAAQKTKAQELKRLFLDWRKQVHFLDLDVQALPARTGQVARAYKVTGDSFRRSPGYGGFTFVTGITADRALNPDQLLAGVIAEQKGMWSMVMGADQRVHIRMHDHEATTKPLVIKDCTPLVLTSYYYRSKLMPKFDHGVWVLTLGGKEVLVEKWSKPAVFPDAFFEPTYVGQDSTGANIFTGQLDSPLFYNEFFYRNDPWEVERDTDWLADRVCHKARS